LSHYLATENPSAAAQIGHEHDPMPGVGQMVLYRPRPTDVKRGRTVLPAMVLWGDPDNRTLELFVISDANDQINQERVPESMGEHERGWVRMPATEATGASDGAEVAALRAELEALREQVFGTNEMDDGALADAVMEFDARIAKLEKLAVKRKPGRPAKPKAAHAPVAA
jgi:hypothetical protein